MRVHELAKELNLDIAKLICEYSEYLKEFEAVSQKIETMGIK